MKIPIRMRVSSSGRGGARLLAWVSGSLAIALLALGLLGAPLRSEAAEGAPTFQAIDLASGTDVVLADLQGEVVLLNTWATWCTPCKEEMPWLQTLHERYAEQGLQVVGVSIDRRGQDALYAPTPPTSV